MSIDSDNDGVCDLLDKCPGENDDQDNNRNGTPDCLERECTYQQVEWDVEDLKIREGAISETIEFS